MKKHFLTLPLAALAVFATVGCDTQSPPPAELTEPTAAPVATEAKPTEAPTKAKPSQPTGKPTTKPTAKKMAALPKLKAIPKDATEMLIEDTKIGDGAEAVSGKMCTMHYTGTLTDGTEFDSSLKHGQPFSFTLGAGEVIKGWDEGVAGMKVGGKRRLIIPPDKGYGPGGQGPIPPNATLIFTVELLGVQ